jgi:glutathione S-transferase
VVDEHFERGPAKFFQRIPAPIRFILIPLIRKKVRDNLYGQGFGRHSRQEILELASRDLVALAAILGDKPHLMGAEMTGVDAIAFSCVAGALSPIYSDSPLYAAAAKHANLVAYRDRLMARYFPEFV